MVSLWSVYKHFFENAQLTGKQSPLPRTSLSFSRSLIPPTYDERRCRRAVCLLLHRVPPLARVVSFVSASSPNGHWCAITPRNSCGEERIGRRRLASHAHAALRRGHPWGKVESYRKCQQEPVTTVSHFCVIYTPSIRSHLETVNCRCDGGRGRGGAPLSIHFKSDTYEYFCITHIR